MDNGTGTTETAFKWSTYHRMATLLHNIGAHIEQLRLCLGLKSDLLKVIE